MVSVTDNNFPKVDTYHINDEESVGSTYGFAKASIGDENLAFVMIQTRIASESLINLFLNFIRRFGRDLFKKRIVRDNRVRMKLSLIYSSV